MQVKQETLHLMNFVIVKLGRVRQLSTEEPDEAGLAVRLVALFFESPRTELLLTECADEMFRVELLKLCRYAPPGDRLVTTGTEGTTFGVIVSLTIR